MEIPGVKKPVLDFPILENPAQEKPTQLITKEINTEIIITDLSITHSFLHSEQWIRKKDRAYRDIDSYLWYGTTIWHKHVEVIINCKTRAPE